MSVAQHEPESVVGSPEPIELHHRRTEGVLLKRTAAGDRDACAALYDLLGPTVYGMACRIVREPALAEEVTQDVFLTVWQSAPSFDSSRGTARTWILTLTHRRAVDVVRREQAQRDRTARSATLDGHEPFDEVADEVLARAETWAAQEQVSRAMSSLTPLQRRSITLAYFEGLTYTQVAERLSIPLSTAKSRIRGGLRRMAVELSGPGAPG